MARIFRVRALNTEHPTEYTHITKFMRISHTQIDIL